MPAGKSLTDHQNELLRVAVRELLAQPKYAGNQTKLATDLKISQGAISAFLGERQGSSLHVAMRAAQLLHRNVMELLGAPEHAVDEDPLVERAEAARFARVNGVREDAIVWARQRKGPPLTAEQWYERMKAKAFELDDEEDASRGQRHPAPSAPAGRAVHASLKSEPTPPPITRVQKARKAH